MGNLFPDDVKRIWDEWNIRGTVLVSLFFQIVLIFVATSRKRTGNGIVNFLIWGAYLLADWVAAFAVGLISHRQVNDCCKSHVNEALVNDCGKSHVNEALAAFWAPFLLLHLGGPDTITAFSLEDNELWLRHLLGLLIQLSAVVYVFLQSVSNEFWIPTVLLFFAGTIKYVERTRALYLACLANFKASMLPKPDAGPNYAQLMEEYSSNKAAQVPVKIVIRKELDKGSRTLDEESLKDKAIGDIEVVQNGYEFFKKFKGLIVDLMFSFHERRESRKFFFERTFEDAFRVMEVELNFMYDALYTKMTVVHCKIGYFFRFICSVLLVVSFYRFASHHKHKLLPVDIAATYTLLIGAISLDFVALVKLIFSDWTVVMLKNSKVRLIVFAVQERLSFGKRCRWSKSISQHSLINYCLKERFKLLDMAVGFFGLRNSLDEMQYKKSKPVEDDLKKFIFGELRNKALKGGDSKIAKEICSAKGNWVLSQYFCPHPLIAASVSEEIEYDESLLLWHVATELCYFMSLEDTDPDLKEETLQNRGYCKLLSEYMLYLLVMRPTMMSAVAGIGQIRFWDTCEEAKKFFRRGQSKLKPKDILHICSPNICERIKKFFDERESESTQKWKVACEKLLSVDTVVKPVEVKGDRSKSLLFDACMLAKDLNKLKSKKRWEIMSRVWVELLSYAAINCRANTHAKQLRKGGELITFVWLLMAHFGLGEQFRIEAGHARAKLIVGK